jgi:predicted ATP-grasp superfamily ATP-dependent carboligase
MTPPGGTLVVAGTSARAMAESARQGGWRVVALDVFGDLDTRRASARWCRIGDPRTLAIDPARLREALAAAAASEPAPAGWVAGGGFEGSPELLDAAPPGLPLLGMTAGAVRALRDPRHFFGTLDRLSLAYPPVRHTPPVDPAGWLAKRAGGTGGWHIRPAADAGAPHADTYWQRHQDGCPMSALFLADGESARVIALNALLVGPLGERPHVFQGAIGPMRDAALEDAVGSVLSAIVPAFGLRGLASLDFIAAGRTTWLLEVNPRPSASMVLHPQAWPAGLMRAHVAAVAGHLAGARARAGVRGTRIVFATRPCRLDGAVLAGLAHQPHLHDVPSGPTAFAAGDPVCSVTAEAPESDAVERLLEARAAAVLEALLPEGPDAPRVAAPWARTAAAPPFAVRRGYA